MTASFKRALLLTLLAFALPLAAQDSLDRLASDYWAWRTQFQPYNSDDIPRIERPKEQKRSWSADSVARQRKQLAGFEARWKKLESAGYSPAQRTDYRLLGSALARVQWELDLNRRWQRDPTFYLEQTMTAVLEALLQPPPFDEARSRELVSRIENIPSLLAEAKANLQKDAAAPFARLALDALRDVRPQLQTVEREVGPQLAGESRARLAPAISKATSALEDYRAWLQQRLPAMNEQTAVGREAYQYFLKNVALYPYTPEQLLQMSRNEWARAVTLETLEHQRDHDVSEMKMFASFDEQAKATAAADQQIRDFLGTEGLLTVPDDLPHYTIRVLPDYLTAISGYGETDDFTGPSRLNQDCTRWSPPPSDKLGYFARASARDPRPLIVHEGVPGHYMQLWLSWRNPDPIRRHYYDSGANEGMGFYAEEMMMAAGLFDDSPHTREVVYNFMRLRALRVEVDVKLALGEFTAAQAEKYLEQMVPMNPETAKSESALFATQPGQAISYQIGKIQIMEFLAEARRRAGEKFDLKAFDDSLWRNGNVPIALQQEEWLASGR